MDTHTTLGVGGCGGGVGMDVLWQRGVGMINISWILEVGRTTHSRPSYTPHFLGYTPPGNLPHIGVQILTFPYSWRSVLLAYEIVLWPSVNKPRLYMIKCFFPTLVRNNTIRKIRTDVAGKKPHGAPGLGRRVWGRFPPYRTEEELDML